METDPTITQQINNSLGKIMAIRSMIEGKELTADERFSLKGVKLFEDFLISPLNSAEETNLKKAFVAAVMVSKATGKIKLEGNYSTEDITIAISEGLTRLKNQYLVGKGKCEEKGFNAKMAEDVILDHEIAALALVFERKIDKWCEDLPNNIEALADKHYDELFTIISAIVSYLSPELADQVAFWINEIAIKFRPEILNLINKGTRIIVNYVRPQIEKLVQKGTVLVQKTKNTLLGKRQDTIKIETNRAKT